MTDVAPLPPWLWLWYGYAALHVPAILTDIRDHAGQLTEAPTFGPVQLTAAAHVLPDFIYLAGLIAVLLPGARTWFVERRWRARASSSPAVRELAVFVAQHAPGVAVTANLERSDRVAGVYPAGWRRTRIAVFAPMVTLWRSDRASADAALRYELGHVRAGDQLMLGLGSPLVFMLKVWAAIFGCLAAATVAVQPQRATVMLLAQPARFLLLPVIGLWLAELGAGRYAGPLSHPPRALRRRLHRPDAPLWPLLIAFPLAVAVDLAVTAATDVTRTARLDHVALWVASALLLALWPGLARWWVRLCTGLPSTAPRPEPRLYAAAAILPAALAALVTLIL